MLFLTLVSLLVAPGMSDVDCDSKSEYSGSDTFYPFELEALPYAEDFLSPFISEDIVIAHYEHHHQTYIDKLNAFIEENDAYSELTLAELNLVAADDESLIKFAGGAYNHYLYWNVLTNPDCTKEGPEGTLLIDILQQWDTIDDFITEFNTTLGTVFGSGWVWACVNEDEDIEIRKTVNQENPLQGLHDTSVCYPFLGADAWEHAYYLDYKWAKQEYYNGFFGAIDWDVVEEFYESYASQLTAVRF